ncbi:MAG: GNAT family N-acetyltransferase [Halanaerobiales bacterium]|nr:GNAT family N-acetyltransferase [Halanaerobiales bacterium]
MIRKLTEQDKDKLMDYLTEEPALNLFMLGDIENYGFNKVDFQEMWGEFDEKEELNSVLLRYYDNNIVYAKGDYDAKGIAEIIKGNNPKMITGKKACVEKIDPYIDISEKRDTYFAKLDKAKDLYEGELLEKIEKTRLEDVKYIWELHENIEEFNSLDEVERKEKKYKDNTGRGYHIFNENKDGVISCAETTAENSYSAMVVGVATDPEHRNKGLASAVMSKLCKEVLDEGKELCLFYDNPQAGKIYKRIGFKDIGIWSMWKV